MRFTIQILFICKARQAATSQPAEMNTAHGCYVIASHSLALISIYHTTPTSEAPQPSLPRLPGATSHFPTSTLSRALPWTIINSQYLYTTNTQGQSSYSWNFTVPTRRHAVAQRKRICQSNYRRPRSHDRSSLSLCSVTSVTENTALLRWAQHALVHTSKLPVVRWTFFEWHMYPRRMEDVSSTLLVAVVTPSRIRTEDEPWGEPEGSARHYPVDTQSPIAPLALLR